MTKEVHFTDAVASHRAIDDTTTEMVFTFNQKTIVDGVETGSQNNCEVVVKDGDTVEETFRKLADDECELFLNGESIGFGALNGGVGMTHAQLEHSAETPEADADVVPEA